MPPPHRIRDAALGDVSALDLCYPADHAKRIHDADGRNVRYLAIEAAGEVVGFGRLTMEQPTRSDERRCLAGVINNLNVRPDMRGRGFGTALIRAMEDMARAAGCAALQLGVKKENARVLALYTRLGYQPFSQFGDRVLLIKQLAPQEGDKVEE
jgi:ribosomal protein S18 acetylase RimI-like enzyme